jgi:hypothetical protein
MDAPGHDDFAPKSALEGKRPDEEREQKEPSKGRQLGELIPTKQDADDAAGNAAQLFQDSADMRKMPDVGKSHIAAKTADWQAQRAEGVSPAQNIAFSNERGEVRLGVQYTNDAGTFFKTPQGLVFRVEPNEKNGFDLIPIGARGEVFSAVELRVLKDLFSIPRDDPSTIVKPRSIVADSVAPPTIERTNLKEFLPKSELSFAPENAAQNQRAEALNRIIGDLRNSPQFSASQIFNAELANLRELSRIIQDLSTSQPDLGALLQIRGLIARSIGGLASQEDFAGQSGQLDFRPDGIVRTEYGISMSAMLVNAITDYLDNRRYERSLLVANAGAAEVAKAQSEMRIREQKAEETARTDQSYQPRPEKTHVEPITHVKSEDIENTTHETEVSQPISEAAETEMIPDATPAPQLAEVDNEIATQGIILQQQKAQESLIAEEEEIELERKEEEEAERVERELIKQQIKKRDEERRRRYVVKERDTFESIAIKQFRDVRLSKLIYEINKHLLPLKVVRGKQVRELKPRMVIFLPTSVEIEKFRQGAEPSIDLTQVEDILALQDAAGTGSLRTPNDSGGGMLSEAGVDKAPASAVSEKSSKGGSKKTDAIKDGGTSATEAAEPAEPASNTQAVEPAALTASPEEKVQQASVEAPAAQSHDEPDDHLIYSVRLGDTLKSIAIRQPQLLDHSLWVLIAEVNGLPTSLDSTGSPTCKLTRGMRLKLPTKSEVEDFRTRMKKS